MNVVFRLFKRAAPTLVMKILILESNPRRDLKLDEEIRDLQEQIKRSPNRKLFSVEVALAVRVKDLQQLLLEHLPQTVHFCGHGSGKQGLVFRDDEEQEVLVSTDALSGLFKLNRICNNVECVLLNACYSEEQADAIVEYINYVIGMNQEIRDDAAIAFSRGFYLALGYKCSIEEAYDCGCNAIQLEISGSSRVRSAATEQQRKLEIENTIRDTVIPEHLKPILKKKRTINAKEQPSKMLSEAKKFEILNIADELSRDKAIKGQAHESNSREENNGRQNFSILSRRNVLLLIRVLISVTIVSIWAKITSQSRLGGLASNPLNNISKNIDINAVFIKDGQEKSCDQQLVSTLKVRNSEIQMVKIQLGEFSMGSQSDEAGRVENESPQHEVWIPSFYMSRFPITQAQWKAVAELDKENIDLNPEPSTFRGTNKDEQEVLPVETVSWEEANEFCVRLGKYCNNQFRLPTEAQWEYACRAQSKTRFHFGDRLKPNWVNYDCTLDNPSQKYQGQTTPVNLFKGSGSNKTIANKFGLVDMHGNVWEWCEDPWHINYKGAPKDENSWERGGDNEHRVLRGGAWNSPANSCRSASRNYKPKNIKMNTVGFRIVSPLYSKPI